MPVPGVIARYCVRKSYNVNGLSSFQLLFCMKMPLSDESGAAFGVRWHILPRILIFKL